jgi:hypothetical protein
MFVFFRVYIEVRSLKIKGNMSRELWSQVPATRVETEAVDLKR